VTRTCIGCRRAASPEEMVRVVRWGDGSLRLGRALPGRGAWLCRGSAECVDQARRRRAFDRALRGPIAAGQVDALCAAVASGAEPEPELAGGSGSEDRAL